MRGWRAVLAIVLVLSVLVFQPGESTAHSENYIHSLWDTLAPTIDGVLDAAEWQDSTMVDLRTVGSNTLDVYLFAKNNDTHLFIGLDAVEDESEDTSDTASISFDGDHDGAPTDNGDHELTIKASVDASCTGFSTDKCHFVYSQTTNRWRANDPMDQGLPYQSGLDAAVGFDNSTMRMVPHRMYEFSVPIEMIGRPVMPVYIGDTVGFYVGRHPLPALGVRDASMGTFAYWPDLGIDPSEYGNLVLGTPADVAITPEFDTKPVRPGEAVQYMLKISSTGPSTDSFDLQASSLQGWTVRFLDAFQNPLGDSGGNPAYPDVGPIASGDYVNVIVEVIADAGADPGTSDLTQVKAYPFTDDTKFAQAILRTGVPYVAPLVDDLESGVGSWYMLPRSVNDWESGTPTFPLGPPGAHTGSTAIGTKLDANYSVCSNSVLYAPFVEIPDWVLGAKMTFWHWYDIISNQQDGGWMEMSINGQAWSTVTPVGGYPATRWGGDPAYAGSSGGWVQVEVNLSDYVGDLVGFRYRFWDYGELIGPTPLPDRRAAGWYLDDFEYSVMGLPAAVSVSPPYQYKVGLRSTEASYDVVVMNIGQQSDAFDIMITNSTEGWSVQFYDAFWNILPDTESPPDGLPDTNRITPGSQVLIRINVTIPASAVPGTTDTKVLTARSSNDDTVSESVILETQVPFALPFSDDMESGPDLWLATPYWHLVHNETFGAVWNISYSGEWAWWYGRDISGNYQDGFRNSGNLTSPPIDLTDSVAAEVSFMYWYETENSMDYDQRWLMVRTGNNPWPSAGQPGTIQLDLRDNRTWLPWQVNLSAYAGKIVQIRLHFDTINSLDNDHQGWYMDDFQVVQTIAKNAPPTIAVDVPAGDELWSGGSAKTLEWTTFDTTDPPSNMLLFANYSVSGGPWQQIPEAQGVPADSTPLSWTLPYENSSAIVVNATVIDSGGLSSYDWSDEFGVDSAPPQVTFYSPQGANVRSTASIVVKFSELMNETSLAPSFGIIRMDTMQQVPGDIYTSSDSIFFDSQYNLEFGTQYQVTISTAAKDDTDPGNPLAQEFFWTFTTISSTNAPPSITILSPSGGESWSGGSNHELSWIASDSEDPTDVLDVWLNYSSSPAGPWSPIPQAQGISGDSTPINWTVPLVNISSTILNATIVDSRGASNSTHSQPFEIDSAPPSISGYFPIDQVPVPTNTQVVVTFSEGMNKFLAESAFELRNWNTGSSVPGLFSWAGSIMTFTPSAALAEGTWYEVEVEDFPTDDSDPGNRLAQNLTWLFETETGDIEPPIVVSTYPDNNEVDISVDLRNVTITFNESMFQMSVVNALSISPYVPYSTSWSNTSLILIINEQLLSGRWYTVRINGSVAQDASNNLLDGDKDGNPGGDFLLLFRTEGEEPAQEEPLDVLPYLVGALIAIIIILLILYLLKGKTAPKEDEEEEVDVTEEMEVEEELKEIDELLGSEEKF